MRGRLTTLAVLALCLGLAQAALAAADAEVAALLERAEFWESRQRDDLAREALDKAFRLAPDHPDALVLSARLQLKSNREAEATATLDRLRKAHPSHPGVAQIAALLRIRGPDRDRLRQARQLARAGRIDDALKAFRAIFPGGFPDDELALEFAQLLAAAPNSWDQARTLVADLARRHPANPRFQLALATHMSARKPVDAETLKSLRELSAIPTVARQAREAWRRAILALDAVEASLPALREYAAANPGDTAAQDRIEQVTQAIAQNRGGAAVAVADPATRSRREGWAALEAGRLEEAEARLREAIARRPNDGEAAGGLGLLRMRQGRHAEALEFFRRASRLDAGNRAKWDGLERTAAYWGLLQQARQARGEGKLELAESHVLEARRLDPQEPNGAFELARVYLAAGRDGDAEALLDALTPEHRRSIGEAIVEQRAGRLRGEARRLEAEGRSAEAIVALEKAAALDPVDPWVRHDLARLYAGRGEAARGQALFDALLAKRPGDADTRYAMALFLSSVERDSDALAVLEGVPAAERTDNMTRLQRRLWVSVQGQRAVALATLGQRAQAERVVAALRDAIGNDIATAIEVARVLGRMDADGEQRALLARIPALGTPTPEQVEAIGEMKRLSMLREARALRAQGRGSEAVEAYRAVLRTHPDNREAQLALIDALMGSGDFSAARPLVESALRADPGDARALGFAATLALRDGHIERAIDYEQRSMAVEGRGESWRYRRLAGQLDEQLGWYFAALDWLHRAGTRGKSQISAQELPLAYQHGWRQGSRWFVRFAPARVSSGRLDLADDFEVSTFGAMLLCQPACEGAPATVETGVALGVGMESGGWRVDLGTTPIGFPIVNVLGGLLHKGDIGPASYSLDLARRPVTSSLLSYAGMRDPGSGRTWGGVVSTGARLNLALDRGGDYGAWGLAGLYRLGGRNVQDNNKAELMAGGYRRLVNEDDRQLALGVTGLMWHFSRNAGEFTFGHGGYYSPRTYRSISLPLSYALRTVRTSLSLRASVSVAWSQSRTAPFFPTDASLQARAEALAPVSFVDPFYSGGGSPRSFGRSLSAAGEHQLAPGVFIGARMELVRSTNYTPNRFLIYIRSSPDGPAARPVSLPPEPGVPGLQF